MTEAAAPKSRVRQTIEFLALLLAAFGIRSFVAEPYEIPTGSMLPTVQIGDRLVISKLAYGARLPFTLTDQVRWGDPQRGDIVVLLNPKPGEPDLAKRVVALPGDVVSIRNGRLVLNGQEVHETPISGPCQDDDRDEQSGRWFSVRCAAFQETLGNTTFEIHHVPGADVPEFGNITVPPDHVFLMGDNRDRSLDSRYFGPVPIGKLKGKAFCVLWSRGPDGMRWDRMLRPIRPPPHESQLAAVP